MRKIILRVGSIILLYILICIAFKLGNRKSAGITETPVKVRSNHYISPEHLKIKQTKRTGYSYYIIADSLICRSNPDPKSGQVIQSVVTDSNLVFLRDTFQTSGFLNGHKFDCNVLFVNCLFRFHENYLQENDTTFGFSSLIFLKKVEFINDSIETNLSFTKCKFRSVLRFQEGNTFRNKDLNFLNCSFGSNLDLSGITMTGNKKDDRFKVKNIFFYGDTLYGTLYLRYAKPGANQHINFESCYIKNIDLSHSNFASPLLLKNDNIKIFTTKKWWTSHLLLSFFISPLSDSVTIQKSKIDLTDANLANLDIDYSLFELSFNDNEVSDNEVTAVYQGLLEKYKKSGQDYNYMLVDIDYHDHKGGVFNLFSKYWWNYGYNKGLIFFWSLLFVLILSILNYYNMHKLTNTYSIDSLKKLLPKEDKTQKRSKGFFSFFIVLLYTSILFFGLKLDFEKIKFSYLQYSLFIIFQYIIGLICTGFILHLVIN